MDKKPSSRGSPTTPGKQPHLVIANCSIIPPFLLQLVIRRITNIHIWGDLKWNALLVDSGYGECSKREYGHDEAGQRVWDQDVDYIFVGFVLIFAIKTYHYSLNHTHDIGR